MRKFVEGTLIILIFAVLMTTIVLAETVFFVRLSAYFN